MASALSGLTGKEAQNLVSQFEGIFKTLPHLPKGLIDFLVNIMAYLAGLGGIFSLLGGISMILNSSNTYGMMGWMRLAGLNPSYFIITGVFQLLSGALLLMAFNPLKGKKLEGWMFLFWVTILGVIQQVVSLLLGGGGIVGMVISVLISFYIIFELKPSYKK